VLVAGTGPDEEEFRRLAQELGADVQFLGFCSGDELHKVIREARAVVLPSEWYENAPVSVLEAYALGKPVIGAAIGGIPEMVRPQETGWLFESASVEALTEQLRVASALPEARVAELGRAGRHIVEQNYTSAGYLERMQDLYRELGVS
jgi:glycosyltransferase involved in cell wall biosynthesis